MESLRGLLESVRTALSSGARATAASELADFQKRLQRRIELELRVLQPALAPIPGRDARRELELEYVQLRELTRILREEIAAAGTPGRALGLLENLERRLRAHATELQRVYYPAALPALNAADQALLLEPGAARAQPS